MTILSSSFIFKFKEYFCKVYFAKCTQLTRLLSFASLVIYLSKYAVSNILQGKLNGNVKTRKSF